MLIGQFQVTSWFDSVCVVAIRWVNLRPNLNMNYSALTTMYERDIRSHTVVTSHVRSPTMEKKLSKNCK